MVEEIPKEERKRMRDLAEFAAADKAQRYWEIYSAHRILLPAAIRELSGRELFKRIRRIEQRRVAWEKRAKKDWLDYNPDDTFIIGPDEEGYYDEFNGPQDWLTEWYARWKRGEIEGGLFATSDSKDAEEFRREKEEDAVQALNYVRNKYFSKRFGGERHVWQVENALYKTMYGIDLHLANLANLARDLRYLLERRQVKKGKEKELADALMDEVAWHGAMEVNAQAIKDVDVLEVGHEYITGGRGPQSWEETKRYHKLVALGPRALLDGLGVLDWPLVQKLREDRRFYKRAQITAAILSSKLEEVLKFLEKHPAPSESPGGGKSTMEEAKPAVITRADPQRTLMRIFEEELRKIIQEDKKVKPEHIKMALERARKRAFAEKIAKSAATPTIMTDALLRAVSQFYMEYTKRYGRPPIILDEEDAKDILFEIEDYARWIVKRGPKHYFKGYVVGLLPPEK